MYYITNQNDQIIAADTELLNLFDVENIDELYKEIALGNINFLSAEEKEKITITTVVEEKIYDVEYNILSGLLGNMTLVQIQRPSEEPDFIDDDIVTFIPTEDEEVFEAKNENELIENLLNIDIDKDEEVSLPDNDLISIKENDDLTEDNIDISDDEISLLLNDEVSEEKEPAKESIIEDNDDELFDLLLPNTAEDTIDEIPEVEENNTSPIYIDIENICQKIGISTDDYNIFLNEFIDTALSVEKDLQNTEDKKYLNAINTLSHLSNVLHLPVVTTSVTQIKNAAADEQDSAIASFYATLGRLTTSQPEAREKENFKAETPFISETDSKTEITGNTVEMDTIEIFEEEALPAVDFESMTNKKESFGTINLQNVKPIHFDFQLEEAAKDLSLPVELIEEFVHDFIEQAHIETEKMLEAYENGDLDTIQKIGHLLKGTASNLRINTLSDTLYEIQFCEDSSKLENLIKQYWGHFLSLENQINLASR